MSGPVFPLPSGGGPVPPMTGAMASMKAKQQRYNTYRGLTPEERLRYWVAKDPLRLLEQVGAQTGGVRPSEALAEGLEEAWDTLLWQWG